MIIEQLMIPYVLASQHSLMHITGFIMCCLCYFQDSKLDIPDLDYAFELMLFNHLGCFAIHVAI